MSEGKVERLLKEGAASVAEPLTEVEREWLRRMREAYEKMHLDTLRKFPDSQFLREDSERMLAIVRSVCLKLGA